MGCMKVLEFIGIKMGQFMRVNGKMLGMMEREN